MMGTKRMFAVFSLVFIFFVLSRSVPADQASHYEIAYQLTRLIVNKESFQDVISPLMENALKAVSRQDPRMQPYAETIKKIIVDSVGDMMDDENLREGLARTYAELFTESELLEMMTFYSSNVGQKSLRIQPELTSRVLAMCTKVFTGEKYKHKIEERLRKAQEMGLLPQKQIDSKDPQFFNNRGVEHMRKGEHDQAISDFSKALEMNPIYVEVYNNRGRAYDKKDQYDQAISDFNKALEISPGYVQVYINRGIAYGKKSQYDQAISDFNKALEINPRNAFVYTGRGFAYSRKGQYDQAISDFNKALEINPRLAEAYRSRGVTYSRKGQYDQAISDYNKAVEINPKDALTYNNRGIAYRKKSQYDQAISDHKKALEINPRYANAYNALAWILATADQTNFRNGEKAVELALEACELSNWKDPNHLGTLGAAYARTGDFENAIKWQEKALESPDYEKDEEAQQRLNFYRSRKAWPPD